MKIFWRVIFGTYLTLSLFNCSSGAREYDLPSTRATEKPDWIGTHKAARDTIFIVITVPRSGNDDLNSHVQQAQSQLHNILTSEIETILRDYWDEKQVPLSSEEKFQLLSALPQTMEQVMNYVTVTDGWRSAEEMAILCALDYEEVASIIMLDMNIDDRSFLTYFKRRMDTLARSYR